jgi:hypothetical protein
VSFEQVTMTRSFPEPMSRPFAMPLPYRAIWNRIHCRCGIDSILAAWINLLKQQKFFQGNEAGWTPYGRSLCYIA